MGNFFSSSSSCSNSINDAKLSNYDIAIYEQKRNKVFWGTIAICIIYTIIALIMFFGSYMSRSFKYVLLNRFFTFTVIFIIGTIMIVAYLYYQVYNFKAIKINRANQYEVLSCPDYWRLEKVNINDDNSSAFDSNISKQLFSYRCVMDPKIFNKTDVAKKLKVKKEKNDASPYDLRITNSGTTDEKITGNVNKIFDIYKNNLYIRSGDVLDPAFSNFNKYSAEQNYPKALIFHHNMIMNNYSKDILNSSSPSQLANNPNQGNILYKYNVTGDNANNLENDLNIHDLEYSSNNRLISGRTDLPFVNLKLTRDTNNVINYDTKRGTDSNIKNDGAGVATNFPIVCDKLYPLYLATADKELNKMDPNIDENLNRCAFSKVCNIPWSDLNCEKYDL